MAEKTISGTMAYITQPIFITYYSEVVPGTIECLFYVTEGPNHEDCVSALAAVVSGISEARDIPIDEIFKRIKARLAGAEISSEVTNLKPETMN